MGEPFDHGPPGWIRQSRKCCTQSIHNHMVVDCLVNVKLDFGGWAAMAGATAAAVCFRVECGDCNLSAPMQCNLAQFLLRHRPLGVQSWTMVVAGSDE